MKNNLLKNINLDKKERSSGITLIALVVSIIILLILAGVAIAMLRGDNGILNRSSEAKFANIIGSFDEQTKLAAMSVRTSIESKKVSKGGYIATQTANTQELADEVATGLGVTAQAAGDSGNSIAREGYTVAYYIDKAGSATEDGNSYIVIWYTDNSLRSTMGNVDILKYGLGNTNNNISPNEAVLAVVIHIGNYNSEMSGKYITSVTIATTDINAEHYESTLLNSKTASTFSIGKNDEIAENNNSFEWTFPRADDVNNNFLADEKDVLLGHTSSYNRDFNKTNPGVAICSWLYAVGAYGWTWRGPLLVSTSEYAVSYYVNVNNGMYIDSIGSLEYNGLTFYYSMDGAYVESGSITTNYPILNSQSNPYSRQITIEQRAIDLLNAYYDGYEN